MNLLDNLCFYNNNTHTWSNLAINLINWGGFTVRYRMLVLKLLRVGGMVWWVPMVEVKLHFYVTLVTKLWRFQNILVSEAFVQKLQFSLANFYYNYSFFAENYSKYFIRLLMCFMLTFQVINSENWNSQNSSEAFSYLRLWCS